MQTKSRAEDKQINQKEESQEREKEREKREFVANEITERKKQYFDLC